jgi:signal transduction histidine kinase
MRNLGEIAQLEQGKRTMQPTRLDLSSFIADTAQLMRSIADLKEVTINLNVERTLVTADREALRTILRNILSNAIKFAPKGGVVEVGTKAPDSFYVHNDGEYIPQEQIDEIMHAKSRVTSHIGTNGESGTGIGLLLCRELVALNRGTMQIISAPHEGVTMVIKLKN